MNTRHIAYGLVTSLALTGCVSEDDPHRRATIGTAVGAVAGAVIGHQVDGGSGKWVGAVVGGLTGYAVGNYMDQQYQELRAALADELHAQHVTVTRLDEDTVKLTLSSEASFDVDSTVIKPAFQPALDRVSAVMAKYDRTIVHIIGHTDSTGSEMYNQQLSDRRANSVSGYLAARGVNSGRLYASGRGENEPRASNDTVEGRRANRRVDLYINAVVEGREQDAYQTPY
ncbi:MAG: OmpA family protein [Pseudomonadota bacterium]